MTKTPPPPSELAALLELSERATPGVWCRCIRPSGTWLEDDFGHPVALCCQGMDAENAEFIVALVNWFRSTRAAALPQGVWLPIESAPKDGTMVLLWGDDQAVVGEWLKCGSPYWLTGLAGDIESTYTHWQPLPPPPPAELGKGDV